MGLYLLLPMFQNIRQFLLKIIDFFHRPVASWVDKHTFRYLVCGGSNTALDVLIFFLAFHFVLNQQDLVLGSGVLTVSSHTAALFIAFSVSFPTGFLLSKYLVFPHSTIRGRIQLIRYALMVATCILLNYLFLHLFVRYFGFYPTPSKVLTTVLVAIFSYFWQRKFTFQVQVPRPVEAKDRSDWLPAAKGR